MADKLTRRGLWTSVIILLVGLTAGFLLLSLVYTGPVWKKVLVFAIYLFTVIAMLRSVSKLSAYLKELESKEP